MPAAPRDAPLGQMTVSRERGLYTQIDAGRVSTGSHYTEDDCWLRPPVREFIHEQVQQGQLRTVLDPFAGDGHILRVVARDFSLDAVGLDLHVDAWPRNDSLRTIPASPQTLICTNPPYLAKYSARRKGVWPLVATYFTDCAYDDLYLLALDRMLACGVPVVAIVPETFIASGLLRRHLDRVVVLEKQNPFSSTDTPVCVACFDPSRSSGVTLCFKDDALVGTLEEFAKVADILVAETAKRRIAFNVADGVLALKAVDGTQSGDRIRFLRGDEFAYDTGMIKVSSRLMTRIQIAGLDGHQLDAVIEAANARLEQLRARSHDMVLSPFKGNNKQGTRRRRLDYRLARRLLASVLDAA